MRSAFPILLAALGCPWLHIKGAEKLVATSREADTAGAPFAVQPIREQILAAAQDGEGRIWAVSREQGVRLSVLAGQRWQSITPEGFPATLRAKGIVTLNDGSIACLWHDESTDIDHLVTQHGASEDALLAKVKLRLKDPRLLPLKDDGLLITHSGPEIIRMGKDGAKLTINRLPDNVFLKPEARDDGSLPEDYAAIHAVEHDGSLWIWTPSLTDRPWLWRLRRIMRVSASECREISLALQKGDEPISVVTPWHNNELAIAVAGHGLISFDVRRNHQKLYDKSSELHYIERIFNAAGRWHLLTCPRPDKVEVKVSDSLQSHLEMTRTRYYDPDKRSNAVLELRPGKDGKLTLPPRTWKLDSEPSFQWWDRPVLTTAAGFWIGTSDGAAFFPRAEGVRPTPFPGRLIQQILPANGDQMLILDDQGSASLRSASAEAGDAPSPSRIEPFRTKSLFVESATGDLLGVLNDGKFHRRAVGAWQLTEVPTSVLNASKNILASDSGQRAWWIPHEGDGPAAIYDFASDNWRVFDRLHQALQQEMAPGSTLLLRDWPGFSPIASARPPHRITFLQSDGLLHFFDSKKWHKWHVHQIAGGQAKATGAPIFQADGPLTISIDWNDHQLSPAMKWTQQGRSPDPHPRLHHSDEARPPPGCPVKGVVSTAYDRFGVCWLVDDQKHLWKCFQGASVRLMESGGKDDPTHGAGFRLYEAHVTRSGDAFLRTNPDWHGGDYLLVHAQHPPAVSQARLGDIYADTASLHFGDSSWHVWKVDDGAWSSASSARSHVLTGLIPGEHHVEVLALNADLCPAETPARLSVKVMQAQMDDLKTWIAAFEGDDLDACEKAARKLRSQGRRVIPLLRRSQANRPERVRWWIEAVIQGIEKPPP